MKRIWCCTEREREDKLSSLVTLDVIVIHNPVKQIDLSTAPYYGVYNTGTVGVTPHMWESCTDHPNIAAVMPVVFIPHIPPPSESGTVTVFCLPDWTELNCGIFITEVTQRPSDKLRSLGSHLGVNPRLVFQSHKTRHFSASLVRIFTGRSETDQQSTGCEMATR